jgi:crotonobetainyl-CoA:carnitine CoA-transferase CaiB-like acyl-CoA transferase
MQTAGQGSCPLGEPQGPLAGVRILDAGNMIAGPMAASLLADYGADVIKLEHPDLLDPLRHWEPKREGISLWWKTLNRNKRLITLNLSEGCGRDLFRQLVRWADVVIENFRPGTFERWGLGYDDLAGLNRGVILARVSGFGQTGPYAGRPGYGTVAEAMSGIAYFTGDPASPPTLPGFPMGDSVAATFTAMAVLAALHERSSVPGGRGQEIDVSLYEPLFRLVDSQVVGYDQLGVVKERMGNRLPEDAPRNAYRTADGRWIAVSASSNRTWARLASAIERPELAGDPRFSSSSDRIRNSDQLDALLADWFAARNCDEVMGLMLASDVAAGPVMNIEDIFRDPQYLARGNIVAVEDPDFGTIRMQGVVPKFARTPGAVRYPGLAPGAHNAEVFGTMLGLGDDDLARYSEAGVI